MENYTIYRCVCGFARLRVERNNIAHCWNCGNKIEVSEYLLLRELRKRFIRIGAGLPAFDEPQVLVKEEWLQHHNIETAMVLIHLLKLQVESRWGDAHPKFHRSAVGAILSRFYRIWGDITAHVEEEGAATYLEYGSRIEDLKGLLSKSLDNVDDLERLL
jgi:hypothetical protein